MSPALSLSVIYKYYMLICLVLFLHDFHSFLSSWIALVLSCLIVTLDPKGFNGEFMLLDLICHLKKSFVPLINVIALPTPMSSYPVKHLLLIFYFVDINNTLPFTKIRQAPVWLVQSRRTLNDELVFQVRILLLFVTINSGR